MKRTAFILSCLLPLMALHAQRLTDPKQLVPELSTLTHPSPSVYLDEFFPNVDEPSMFHGPVRSVTTTYEIPYLLNLYAFSHMQKVHASDSIHSRTTKFVYDSTGGLQCISEKYVLYNYYYRRKKPNPIGRFYYLHILGYNNYLTKLKPELLKDVSYGEKKLHYRNGRLRSYMHVYEAAYDTAEIKHRKKNSFGGPPYYITKDDVRVKYDAGGNPISALREREYNKRFRFAYDSLGRLVYMSNKEYLNTKVCAWLYDSTGCVAMAVDKPGDSIREMRLLHKEPQPDGTMKLRIIWCRNAAGVDKSEYRQLYNKPDSSLAPFFSKRLVECEEKEHATRTWKPEYNYLYNTTGEYVFDTAGRLTGYTLQNASTMAVRYDSAGRVMEIKTVGIAISFPYRDYQLPDGSILWNGNYRQILFSYDEEGQVSEIALTDQSGKKEVISIRYTYDSHHNWIRREVWRDDKLTGAVSRQIEYAE